MSTQICKSFRPRKGKLAPNNLAWQGPWRARPTSAILDVNLPGPRLNLYGQLPLPPLHPNAVQNIVCRKRRMMPRNARRSTLWERQKTPLTSALARKRTAGRGGKEKPRPADFYIHETEPFSFVLICEYTLPRPQ
jgi:hypothetical protein